MFESLSNGFKSAMNKLRFSDDSKALDKALDELKKVLLKSDVYHKTTKEILSKTKEITLKQGIGRDNFLNALSESLKEILSTSGSYGFTFANKPPTNVLMVGLQGSGKTTTCAKLANYLKTKNKKVLLVPCDLQRLAAVTQLKTLGAQIEVPVFESSSNDPLKVAKDALEYGTKEHFDVIIFDSAGRLAIDSALMNELKEIKKIVQPHDTFYVADALSGQDGIRSAASFNEQIGVSGVILSKFDSDSKGGIALSIAFQLGIPLRFMGVGEKIADLDLFMPDRIISRLMGAGDLESLAEKTAAAINPKEAKDIHKKIKKGNFTFIDFLNQIENVKKMGSVSSILSMIPGLGNMAKSLKGVDIDNTEEVKIIRAMVNSMTKKERENPDILNGSRRKRIANGAGLQVSDINRALKQFDQASKIAKKLSQKGGMQNFLAMMSQQNIPR
ncbi:signal recognition particle protein [Helicobacter saguini]|uniref:signal-recognition-particle GTPase n=1 Tax=Helicobacter saguini TaxID=1548018 RepID=A0A347VQP1_9HELI|nr:signal recognition particle protein [Helicobacter saguini]MWV63216.1 signal recognition particle protein [Helicobacter saguini]MWV66115.1 signal recognition particle protein [Helicobacter saguini]MWV68465.1 signal recognition particle protein [Helicobacter saguini]MWV71981.1 signal recognition particle protein [Helicobacter saguini]TLD95988.1 signal recognition particle protein [Helicobacter saguini]